MKSLVEGIEVHYVTTLPTVERPTEQFITVVRYDLGLPRPKQRFVELGSSILARVDELGTQELLIDWSSLPSVQDLCEFTDRKTGELLIATCEGRLMQANISYSLTGPDIDTYLEASKKIVERRFRLHGFEDDD